MKAALPRLDYKFGDDGFEITLGKLVLARTEYGDIAKVAPIEAPKLPKLPSWRSLVKRARAMWPAPVLVRRRSGWLRRLVVAPKNPTTFVNEMQERIDAAAKAEKKAKPKNKAAAGTG
jgi:hypothetical protein